MGDPRDKRPQFFRDVHQLAQAHGIVAYVVVGVVHENEKIAIATGAGSRLSEEHEATPGIYDSLSDAFERALASLTEDEEPTPAKGRLLN